MSLFVTCSSTKSGHRFTECFYADDTKLVGEGSTLNSKPLMVTKTADCIDACTKTWGCRYWTVEKPLEKDSPVQCYLKAWRGRQVATPGFISGSLPSACCKSKKMQSFTYFIPSLFQMPKTKTLSMATMTSMTKVSHETCST